jgi:hypothetical protein
MDSTHNGAHGKLITTIQAEAGNRSLGVIERRFYNRKPQVIIAIRAGACSILCHTVSYLA